MATSLWGEGARPFNEEICWKPPLLDSCGDSWNPILDFDPAPSGTSKGQIMQTVSDLQADGLLRVYLGLIWGTVNALFLHNHVSPQKQFPRTDPLL